MEKQGWKTLAIICMAIIVIILIMVGWLFNIGANSVNQENKCAVNICGNEKYTSYYYDDYEEICYCFEPGQDEPSMQEYVG